MNLQTEVILRPLRVFIVNPLMPTGQMVISKILSGFVFGENQLIDLIILVYANEKPIGERLRLDFVQCAYPCYNTITVSSDLPSMSDADVFCFLSNFYNLNKIILDNMNRDDQFDALYLITKIANNLTGPALEQKEIPDAGVKFEKKSKKEQIIPRKPIFMADGLAALDILMSLSKNISSDLFFCPTTIPDVANSVLGEYLKVQCNELNDILVWAANDEVFHVEMEKPIIVRNQVGDEFKCDSGGKPTLQPSDLDPTQFSSSWMKKEFIAKVTASSMKNPYGSIFRASLFARALKCIWTARTVKNGQTFCCNMGVISEGSLGTKKGLPYVLPLIFNGDTWTVNSRYKDTSYLKNELKRINQAVKEHHQIWISYCKGFLQKNVIDQDFIPDSTESSSEFMSSSSTKSSY